MGVGSYILIRARLIGIAIGAGAIIGGIVAGGIFGTIDGGIDGGIPLGIPCIGIFAGSARLNCIGLIGVIGGNGPTLNYGVFLLLNIG